MGAAVDPAPTSGTSHEAEHCVDLVRAAERLEQADPREVVAWALEVLDDRCAIACSFQAGSLTVVDMARRLTHRPIRIIFLDTGFHFPETQAFRDQVVADWGLEMIQTAGPGARRTQDAEHGPELYRRDPDRCCWLNRVQPLQAALANLDGWLTGLRRDESPTRATTPLVQRQVLPGRTLLKVNPIARWTKTDLWHYVRQHGVPTHPLYERGYTSIGCAPCTRPIATGEDDRAGRWAGDTKTECGIHRADLGRSA